LSATLASGRRVLELTDREPAIVDPTDPAPAPRGPATVALEGVTARYASEAPVIEGLDLFSSRAHASRSSARAERGRRR
jgi:ABC-type multidrug transport system fused ATPase/permease subunit